MDRASFRKNRNTFRCLRSPGSLRSRVSGEGVIPSTCVQCCIMPKTIKLESHLDSQELEGHYRKAHDPVLRSHYQILWLIGEGKTTTQVIELTGYSRGWIQQLARRYNEEGPEALGDRRHGNPGARDRALLSAEQQEELGEALKKPP